MAKSGGYELTIVEAEAYLSEFADKELNEESLARVSCGLDWPSGCRHTIRFVIVTILFEETITYEEKELVLPRGSALNIIRPHGSFAAPA